VLRYVSTNTWLTSLILILVITKYMLSYPSRLNVTLIGFEAFYIP
jgi:hypothetical protein